VSGESGELPLVAIYADESCLGNGREGANPGGAAGVIEHVNPATERLTRWDYWIAEPATTNNRMALRSAIEAFRVISRRGGRFRVLFTSDSQYLVKGMTEWVYGWASRGWRRKEGPIENLELWRELVDAAAPHRVQWQWVRGHAGHPQNEYANDLAVRAARAGQQLEHRHLVVLIRLHAELAAMEPVRKDRGVQIAHGERLREELRRVGADRPHQLPVHPLHVVHRRSYREGVLARGSGRAGANGRPVGKGAGSSVTR
jgi:ribonuclease HI